MFSHKRDSRPTLSNTTRTCNKLPDVHMCTPEPALMDMDRGTLARIDRKLLAGLGDDEAYRTVRVPTIAAKWSTWRRYCESVGISMGRAVTLLIDRELIAVFGDVTGDDSPVFAQRAREQLAIREAKIAARGRQVDAEQARMRAWGERLRRWEEELEVRERRRRSCRSSRHVTRPFAPRSDATNAAPAGPAASTSTAMARPAAEHNESPIWAAWFRVPVACLLSVVGGLVALERTSFWVYGCWCSGFGPFCSLYRWRVRVVESLSRKISVSRLSDVDGLDRLYRQQAPRMWRALTAYSGSREVAQDAVAEAFAQAIARGGEIRSHEHWVWRAAYRIAAGELKRRGSLTELLDTEPVTDEEPAWEIRAALAKLSPMQRSAVVLHYYVGYQASEIARITGSTTAAVWVHLSRGRRYMAKALEENDD